MSVAEVDVLVVGAGPVGLTAAVELRRRGVACRVIDESPERKPFAKAVGIQPRTWEVWESMGMARAALDLAVPLRGQLVYVNGEQVARTEMTVPSTVPFGFAALPQFETERLLAELLASWGTSVERHAELTGFTQDSDGVRARVRTSSGEEEIRSRFLIGCDGAHSTVRRGLGLSFEGAAFPEQYMLGDVEVDWRMPAGYVIRSMREDEGETTDVLVCVPLPGLTRYRMSMLVPPELAMPATGGNDVTHGLEADRAPELHHIQAVLDRLAPRSTTASALRWSSVFRISHRIVNRYCDGRVFVAGDAAHIHPPTGAQGMNTGIQDAHNLAWKVALAVDGVAADGLLDSYDAERLPVGEEVVGRTVRHARSGVEADPDDPSTVLLREAQLLIDYGDSPVVQRAEPPRGGPAPGARMPDCGGLARDLVNFPIRLFELLRGADHALLLYADGADQLAAFPEVAEVARARAHGRVNVHVIVAPDVPAGEQPLPVVRDARDQFRDTCAARGGEFYLVRPDGHLGFRGASATALDTHLRSLFAA